MAKTLFVGNLTWGTTNEDLLALFQGHGEVIHVQIITDWDTGHSRGFAFVAMANDDAARMAVESLSGSAFKGRPLTVNEAQSPVRRGP